MIKVFMIGYSNNKGGVETYIDNLIKNSSDDIQYILSEPIMEIDGKKWVRPQNRHNYIKYSLFWKRFFETNNFDVVYYNTCDIVSIDALKFAKKAGIKMRIIHSHNSGLQQSLKKNLSYFHKMSEIWNKKNIKKYATHLFACSEKAGRWMFNNNDFILVKNGIDLNHYIYDSKVRRDIQTELDLKDKFILACIGRLSHQKNPFFSVDVFEELQKIKSNAVLLFIGDGELKEDLEKYILSKQLSDKIKLLGNCDNVHQLLSSIDCLLMPSIFEGLPFVLVESQATGLPCVVSDTVSVESQLTNLVSFVNLNENKNVWVEQILKSIDMKRYSRTTELTERGYSFKKIAEFVTCLMKDYLLQ